MSHLATSSEPEESAQSIINKIFFIHLCEASLNSTGLLLPSTISFLAFLVREQLQSCQRAALVFSKSSFGLVRKQRSFLVRTGESRCQMSDVRCQMSVRNLSQQGFLPSFGPNFSAHLTSNCFESHHTSHLRNVICFLSFSAVVPSRG